MPRLALCAIERDDGRVTGRYFGRRLHLERFRRERVARVWDALDVLQCGRLGRGVRKDGDRVERKCGLWLWSAGIDVRGRGGDSPGMTCYDAPRGSIETRPQNEKTGRRSPSLTSAAASVVVRGMTAVVFGLH